MGFESIMLDEINKTPGYINMNADFLNGPEFSQSNIPLDYLRSFYETNQQISWKIKKPE